MPALALYLGLLTHGCRRTLVRADSNTRIKQDDHVLSLSNLRVGERVEVQGRRLADRSVLASRIEVEHD